MSELSKLRVADLMTRDPVTLNPNDQLKTADDVMKLGRIRHLPVLDDEGSLVGIVSARDLFMSGLLRALGLGSHARDRALEDFMVKEAMHVELVSVTPDTPLTEAAQLLVDKKVGCALVLEDERLVGILTESDFVRLATREG